MVKSSEKETDNMRRTPHNLDQLLRFFFLESFRLSPEIVACTKVVPLRKQVTPRGGARHIGSPSRLRQHFGSLRCSQPCARNSVRDKQSHNCSYRSATCPRCRGSNLEDPPSGSVVGERQGNFIAGMAGLALHGDASTSMSHRVSCSTITC